MNGGKEPIERKRLIERRRPGRFKAKEGVVVEFSKPRFFNLLKPRVVKSAHIIDISNEGLAFEYEGRKMWTTDFKELSISVSGDDEKIDSVPFKIISDRKIANFSESVYGRRCGVQFGQLAAHHRSQIHHFIKNHTIHSPKPPHGPDPDPKGEPFEDSDKTGAGAYYVELFKQ